MITRKIKKINIILILQSFDYVTYDIEKEYSYYIIGTIKCIHIQLDRVCM